DGKADVVEFHPLLATTMTVGTFSAGVIDQDATHRFGGGGEEMRTVVPLSIFMARELEPDFMDERGGLKCLTRCFLSHLVRREPAQFLIYQRKQLVGGTGICVVDGFEKSGKVAHVRLARAVERLVPAVPSGRCGTGKFRRLLDWNVFLPRLGSKCWC